MALLAPFCVGELHAQPHLRISLSLESACIHGENAVVNFALNDFARPPI
jgi:hypothetical protein